MKKIAVVAVIALLSGIAHSSRIVDKTIAKVNGQAIFLSEFEKNLNSVLEMQKRIVPEADQTPEWMLEQKKAVLKQMIDDKILLSEAKAKNVKVNKRDMEDGINQIKSRFKRDETGRELSDAEAEKAFQEELKKEGLSQKEFEDRVRDQFSVVKLIDQEIKSRITPPAEDEVREAYNKTMDIMQGKKVSGIDEADMEDYETLAKYFEERSAERVSASHILIRSDRNAPKSERDEALKRAREIRSRVLKNEDFGELAEKYSDDTESARRGGILGSFIKGWMVPEFEKAAFKLNVSEISDVVETEYGYHIIKVEEKRAAQRVKYEDVKNEVAEFVYRLKLKKRYDLWIEALTKNANIQILEPELR